MHRALARYRSEAAPHWETIHQWCRKFGQTYAHGPRRRRARPGDTWHLDEVFITINGKRQYLWRSVDQAGTVLDILVSSRRDAKAATRFFRKLLKGLEYAPRVLVTDKLGSYGVARRRLIPGVEHRQSKYLNNRAENSHQPTPTPGASNAALPLPGRGAEIPVRVLQDLTGHCCIKAKGVLATLRSVNERPLDFDAAGAALAGC